MSNLTHSEPQQITKQQNSALKHETSGQPSQLSDSPDELKKMIHKLEEEVRSKQVEAINQQEEIAEWQRSYDSLQTEGQELFQTYERKCNMLKQAHKELEEAKVQLLAKDKSVTAAVADRDAANNERDELRAKVKAQAEAAAAAEERFFTLKLDHARALERLDELEAQLNAASFAARAPSPAHLSTHGAADGARIAELESEVAQLNAKLEELRKVQDAEPRLQEAAASPAGDRALPLSAITPSRKFMTPGKTRAASAAPRTPSALMLEVDTLSPDGLRERLEALVISNDLLRQELDAMRQERDAKMAELKTLGTKLEAVQEDALPLQAKLRAAAAQVKSLTEARDEAMAEAEAAHRDLVELQQERKAGSAALEAELDTAKEACEAAEVSRRSAEAESEKLRRALEKQVEATKNAENDMRLMYKRHKKETQEVADKFRAGEYEARYEAAVAKAAQLEGLLANWVNYAKEVNQLRTLHGQLDEADARAAAEARGLIDDADAMRADAETKCAKWERQCARMQKEMTELVGIKTRALEQRKEIHERYVELLEELKAQGEYASSLEEEVAALQEQLANVPAQLDAAREAGVDAERARGPSTESQIEAVITEMVTSVEQSMLQARVASLEEELQEHVAASEASDRLFEQTAVAMQDKDETCATLAAQLAKAQGELADAVHRTEENRVSSEAESAASQEALDEMTRSLAAEKERAEEADARAKACAAAAACGIARLTHVTVGMASGEDDTTELIDPELRLHWCDDSYEAHLAGSKTPAELRALLVSVTSTAEALLNKACERGEAQAAQLTELQMAMFNLEARREEAAQEAKAAAERLAEAQRDLAAMEEAKEASSAEAAAKTELIAVLEETVADSNASAAAAKEEKEELSAMLEETTRENMALSEAKQEAEAAIPERDMLRAQLEESHIARGKAEAAEARARESVQKRIATLTANLTKSDAEAASLECLIAHVRAVLQQTIEEPSGPASEQTLRALLSRISTEESHDDE